jgi:hypothetical protein
VALSDVLVRRRESAALQLSRGANPLLRRHGDLLTDVPTIGLVEGPGLVNNSLHENILENALERINWLESCHHLRGLAIDSDPPNAGYTGYHKERKMLPDNPPYCDPNALGPLTGDPVVATGTARIFEGEERFLSKRKLEDREKMWQAAAHRLDLVLEDGEKILYLLPALHVPKILEQFGFGVWWSMFFRTMLVLTDQRLIEITTPDWKRIGTKTCSYPWPQVGKIKLSMGTLTVAPARGRTQKWKLPVRGDRKLLKLLTPKLRELLPIDIHAPQTTPLWLCPKCGAATESHPKVCAQCGTQFKTSGLAAGLALAFPGAGLFYAGHPALGLFDLFGELVVYVFIAGIFLTATSPGAAIGAAIAGLFFFGLTKLESAHLSTTLVKRTVPVTDPGRWRKLAAAGAVASVILLALPPAFTGAFADPLDRDLDLSTNTFGWNGGHDPEAWVFGADPRQRSEWIREDGPALFVFSMPSEESAEALTAALEQDGQQTESRLFAGFRCVRSIGELADEDGNPLLYVRWFIFDDRHRDLHIIAASVYPEDLELFEPQVEETVRIANWIPLDS